jgi:hypothetical protein
MHKRLLLGLVLSAVSAFVPLHAQTAAAPAAAVQPPGQIIAAKVTGKVTMTIGAAAPTALNNNDAVPEHAVVTTDPDASVVLVFSNGATTQLGSDTILSIDQFLQDPFSAQIKVADLDAEPTTSKTKLRLTRGELVGNVKHLNHTNGSTFTIETPVGAAGIRGTTFRIVFRPSGTGLAFFSLSTVEGNVAFQQPNANGGGTGPAGTPGDANAAGGNTGGGSTNPPGPGGDANAGGGTTGGGTTGGGTTGGTGSGGTGAGSGGLAVTSGQEVVVTVNVTVNPTTNVVTVSAPVVVSNTTTISAATMQTLTNQAVTIATTAATVTFTPTPPASGGGSGSSGSGDSGNSGSNSGSTSGNDSGSNSGTDSTGGTGSNGGSGSNSNSSGTSSNNGNSGANLGKSSPPATSSTPTLTSGDGKSS